MRELRRLGYDPAAGRTAYVAAAPGGMLEALADQAALEAGAALLALVGTVLDGGRAADGELAALVVPPVEVLGDVLDVAVRGQGCGLT